MYGSRGKALAASGVGAARGGPAGWRGGLSRGTIVPQHFRIEALDADGGAGMLPAAIFPRAAATEFGVGRASTQSTESRKGPT